MANTWTAHSAEWRCVQMLFPLLVVLLFLSEGAKLFDLWGQVPCFLASVLVNGWGVFITLNTWVSSSGGKSLLQIAMVVTLMGLSGSAMAAVTSVQISHASCHWAESCGNRTFTGTAVFSFFAATCFMIDTAMTALSWQHYRTPWDGKRPTSFAMRRWRRRRKRKLAMMERAGKIPTQPPTGVFCPSEMEDDLDSSRAEDKGSCAPRRDKGVKSCSMPTSSSHLESEDMLIEMPIPVIPSDRGSSCCSSPNEEEKFVITTPEGSV